MKRITCLIITLILCLSLLSLHAFSANPAVSVTGPQSAEKGQVVQVELKLTATDVYAMSGKFSYDTSVLQLESAKESVANSTVILNTANNKFTVYHNAGEYLVNGTGTIVVLKFTVLESTTATAASVEFKELVATDGQTDLPVADVACSIAIVSPEPETTEPETTEPETTEPKPTEPKPTEPKPTEPKPTEPKPTEPKPTEPKPTETTPTEPDNTDATEPEPTTEATAPSGQGTEPSEPAGEPTEPGEQNGEGKRKTHWLLWILILILLIVLAWHLVEVYRKKKRQ